MMNVLSSGKTGHRKELQKAYNALLRREVIGEKKDENGRIVTRFIIRKKKETDATSIVELPASVYRPDLYSGIVKRTVYKAEITVGPPENLDRTKNTCTFTSLTDGSKYSTSLEKCTCPAYGGKEACKHMVKLAMTLGYYHRY